MKHLLKEDFLDGIGLAYKYVNGRLIIKGDPTGFRPEIDITDWSLAKLEDRASI